MNKATVWVLAVLLAAVWFWAGWRAGRAELEEIRAEGCRFLCVAPVEARSSM